MLKKYFPIADWAFPYKKSNFRGDLTAGLTVGVMLIPQGMAYSMLAGLPPIYGLYASTIPLIIYAIFGTSRQLAVGPSAMIALLVGAGVSQLASPGTELYITYAIFLALMVGIIQFGLGFFRLGFIVNFLSHPVISGFTSAAALIIGLSQLKHLFGIQIARTNYVHEILINTFDQIGNIHMPTLLLGLGGMGLILFLKRMNKGIPGSLIAVILGIIIVYLFNLDETGMKIVREVPQGLPSLFLPSMDGGIIRDLLPIAVTIALVGFMESVAIAKAFQSKSKQREYKVIPNQELIGLGLANAIGSFFQAFPTTGGFSRSAVNFQAGAKTGLASIISAILIILTLLFLTPLFYYLPQAILASIIMVAVFGLIDLKEARHLWVSDRKDFYMLMVTFLSTLLIGIEEGIIVGVILSIGMVIWRVTYPHVAPLGRIPGTDLYRNLYRFPEAEHFEDILIFRFDAQLFFANTSYMTHKLEQLEEEHRGNVKLVILSAKAINGVDSTAIHALKDLAAAYKSRGIELYFADAKGPVRDAMVRGGLVKEVGRENFFGAVHEAVQYFRRVEMERFGQNIVLQTDHIQNQQN